MQKSYEEGGRVVSPGGDPVRVTDNDPPQSPIHIINFLGENPTTVLNLSMANASGSSSTEYPNVMSLWVFS